MGKIILNGVDYSAANNSSNALPLSGGTMDDYAEININGQKEEEGTITTTIGFDSMCIFQPHDVDANSNNTYITSKKIETYIAGHGQDYISRMQADGIMTSYEPDTSYNRYERSNLSNDEIVFHYLDEENDIDDILKISASKNMDNSYAGMGIYALDNQWGYKSWIRFWGENIFIKTSSIQPESDRVISLGSANQRWSNIYATNGTIQTSDRTRKTDINNLETQKAKAFINGLNPVSYKMVDGTSGRTHYGLIAQDIEELMNTLNMDSSDFAGFIKSPKKITKYEDENGKKLKKPIEEVIEGEYDYSLRYDEFIAPLIKVVQEQQKEIEKLKEMIAI